MDFDWMNLTDSLFRWAHVVAGVLWIGLLYFFNWVNSAFAPTMDAETKKKVVPELLPRTLYWFRWGAAWTWVTGVTLLMLVFYRGRVALLNPTDGWGTGAVVMMAFVFLSVFLYDILYKTVLKNPTAGFWGGLVLATAVLLALDKWAMFGQRGTQIHLGAMFGTFMAFNVWYRIWPAQQKIIRAIKNGDKPDGDLLAIAGTRSKHNTYMSVPLIFMMVNSHTTWVASNPPMFLAVIIFAGWSITWMLYKRAAKVKGF